MSKTISEVQNYLKSLVGKGLDYDGRFSEQCYDLANYYCDFIGAPKIPGDYAYQMWNNYDRSAYTAIPNTRELVARAGDLVIWGIELNGYAGHVAVATGEGNIDYFVSLDQNWNSSTCQYVTHNWNNVLGVLRPKAVVDNAPADPKIKALAYDGVAFRTEPHTRGGNSTVKQRWNTGDTIDQKGFIHGEKLSVDGYTSDIWFVSKLSGLYSWSGFYTDKSTSSLTDYGTWGATEKPKEEPKEETPIIVKHDPEFGATWVGATAYSEAEERKTIDHIIIHWMAGTLSSCDNTFKSPTAQASAHFGVEDKKLHQYVLTSEVAWHAGDWEMNQHSIGIEHSAEPGRDATEETYKTSAKLIKKLCNEFNIPLDREHIIGHNEVMHNGSRVATQCPGTIDIDKLIELAGGKVEPVEPTPYEPPKEEEKRPNYNIYEELSRIGEIYMDEAAKLIEEAGSDFNFSKKTRMKAYFIGDALLIAGVETPLITAAITAADPVTMATAIASALFTAGVGILTVFKLAKK